MDHNKLWKILQEMGIPDHLTLPTSWETYMQIKKQQLEPDMEHGLVRIWETSVSRLYIVTLLI